MGFFLAVNEADDVQHRRQLLTAMGVCLGYAPVSCPLRADFGVYVWIAHESRERRSAQSRDVHRVFTADIRG